MPYSPSVTEAKPYIGGQAVLEGVMMRAPSCMTVAVRRPDGTLAVKEELLKPRSKSLAKVPFVRGMAMLGESMKLGYRALQFSADQQMLGAPAKDASVATTLAAALTAVRAAALGVFLGVDGSEPAPGGAASKDAKMDAPSSTAAIALSIVIAIGLFIALPQALAWGLGKGLGLTLTVSDWRYQATIGGFKLLVITAYMVFLSRVPEMRRVFQYHGAEHKTIYAYEAAQPLTLENVRAQSTLHPRCGTTFLIVVVAVSVLVFIAVAPFVTFMTGPLGQLQVFALRLALLPVIAGVAYELQRLTARYCTTGPMRVFLWPGFLFQKITTREPDDAQLEVAIVAMKAAEWRDQHQGAALPAEPAVYPSFAEYVASLSPAAAAPEAA